MNRYVDIGGHRLTPTQMRALEEVARAGGAPGCPVRLSLSRVRRACGVREGAARNALHALCDMGLAVREPVFGSDGGQRANAYAPTEAGERVIERARRQGLTHHVSQDSCDLHAHRVPQYHREPQATRPSRDSQASRDPHAHRDMQDRRDSQDHCAPDTHPETHPDPQAPPGAAAPPGRGCRGAEEPPPQRLVVA